METYCVAGCVLLLCADDRAASLGGVEGALALDDFLAHAGPGVGFAADLGHLVPVVHFVSKRLLRRR